MDVVVFPLIHPPIFHRDFWTRGHSTLDRFDKFGQVFVYGMEVRNQPGVILREMFRGHGRWRAQGWSSKSDIIDFAWYSDQYESGVIASPPRTRNGPYSTPYEGKIDVQQVYPIRRDSLQNTRLG